MDFCRQRKKRTPKFIDRGYLSIIFEGILKGKPKKAAKKVISKLVYNNSRFARHIMDFPGGEEALNEIYEFDPDNPEPGHTFIDRLFLNFRVSKGTRRRKDEYQSIAKEKINELDYGNILELGAGRGKLIMEVFSDFLSRNGDKRNHLNLTLVDVDYRALSEAQRIARKLNLDNVDTMKVNLKKQKLNNLLGPGYRSEATFGHGLFDYFTRDKLIMLLKDIADIQVPGSPLVSSNILHHDDRIADWFMREIGN